MALPLPVGLIAGAAGHVGWHNDIHAYLNALLAGGLSPTGIDVSSYVDGDGIADDSAGFQAALTDASTDGRALLLGNRKMRVTDNLYWWGDIDIVGSPGAEIILDADLGADDKFWCNAGINAKGVAGTDWTGSLTGVKLSVTGDARCDRMLNVHRGENYLIANNVWDLTAAELDYVMSGIAGYNDAAWCSAPGRRNAYIMRNRVIAAQRVGGEGIGHHADGLWTLFNNVHGVGDDMLAHHFSTNVVSIGNRLYGNRGRLGFFSCADVYADGNYIERIAQSDATWFGGGSLVEVVIEDPTMGANTRMKILNTTMVLPADVPSATYMMRLQGLRDSVVEGVIARSDCADAVSAVQIEPDTNWIGSWSDPDGIEPDDIARSRNVDIIGVKSVGAVEVGIQQVGTVGNNPGPVNIRDCALDQWLLPHASTRITNCTPKGVGSAADPAAMMNVLGDCFADEQILFEGSVSVAAGATVLMARNSGDRFYPRRPGLITALEITTSANLTAGYLYPQVAKNGAGAVGGDGFALLPATPRGAKVGFYADATKAFDADDYFKVSVASDGATLPTPALVWVRVYGVYV